MNWTQSDPRGGAAALPPAHTSKPPINMAIFWDKLVAIIRFVYILACWAHRIPESSALPNTLSHLRPQPTEDIQQ